jgi:hypothetical protein
MSRVRAMDEKCAYGAVRQKLSKGGARIKKLLREYKYSKKTRKRPRDSLALEPGTLVAPLLVLHSTNRMNHIKRSNVFCFFKKGTLVTID